MKYRTNNWISKPPLDFRCLYLLWFSLFLLLLSPTLVTSFIDGSYPGNLIKSKIKQIYIVSKVNMKQRSHLIYSNSRYERKLSSYAIPKGAIHPKKGDAFELLQGGKISKGKSKTVKEELQGLIEEELELRKPEEEELDLKNSKLEQQQEQRQEQREGVKDKETLSFENEMGRAVVILVRPYLDQNVGAVARGMLNFGLTELRIVSPFCNHTSEAARARSSGADTVLEQAKVFTSIEEAIGDLTHIFATSARLRDRTIRIHTPDQAVEQALHFMTQSQATSTKLENGSDKKEERKESKQGNKGKQEGKQEIEKEEEKEKLNVGFMFGSERNGLSNDELTYANSLVCIPAHPNFSSLNLSMAVNIIGYEYWSQLCKYLESQREKAHQLLRKKKSIAILKDEEANENIDKEKLNRELESSSSLLSSSASTHRSPRPSTIQSTIFKLPPSKSVVKTSRLAKKSEITTLINRLVELLDELEYQPDPNRKKYIIQRITSIFNRAEVDEKDVNTFHGIISSIYRGHHRLPINDYYYQKDQDDKKNIGK